MQRSGMKKGFFLILFSLGTVLASAQKQYFVFIQTQNKQPFYVRYQNEIFSSTEIGYVVIPKIKTDSIDIVIGFPRKLGGGIKYRLAIDRKDRGFVIRQLDTSLWAMYDIENMKMVMPVEVPVNNQTIIKQSTDPFTILLAQVINTPAIAQKIVINDSLQAITDYYHQVLKFSTDTPIIDNGLFVIKTRDTVFFSAKHEESLFRKVYGVWDTIGYFGGYIAALGDEKDTINIFIPVDTVGVVVNLKAMATENDILRIKQEWALFNNEMVICKTFREKLDSFCFSVNQIQELSGLLQVEENKLMFYKLAFPQIVDKFHFNDLQTSFIKQENVIQFQKMFVNN